MSESKQNICKREAIRKINTFREGICQMFSNEPNRRVRIFLSSLLNGYGLNDAETKALDKEKNLRKY